MWEKKSKRTLFLITCFSILHMLYQWLIINFVLGCVLATTSVDGPSYPQLLLLATSYNVFQKFPLMIYLYREYRTIYTHYMLWYRRYLRIRAPLLTTMSSKNFIILYKTRIQTYTLFHWTSSQRYTIYRTLFYALAWHFHF